MLSDIFYIILLYNDNISHRLISKNIKIIYDQLYNTHNIVADYYNFMMYIIKKPYYIKSLECIQGSRDVKAFSI